MKLVLAQTKHHSSERRPTQCPYCRGFVYADEHTYEACQRVIARLATRAREHLRGWELKMAALEARRAELEATESKERRAG